MAFHCWIVSFLLQSRANQFFIFPCISVWIPTLRNPALVCGKDFNNPLNLVFIKRIFFVALLSGILILSLTDSRLTFTRLSTIIQFHHRNPIKFTKMCENLNYIINHVFLPARLPHHDDSSHERHTALVKMVLAALETFQDHVLEMERADWLQCTKMIRSMLHLRNGSGDLVAGKVKTALRKVSVGGTRKQNLCW